MHPFDNALHLRLDINRPKRSFEVLTCKGSEAADRPYTFQLEILSPAGALDAHELLFSACYLYVRGSNSGINGHIQSIVRSTTEPVTSNLSQSTPLRYQVTLGPRLGLMGYRHNQRIFQGMSAERIITQVLSEHGIDDSAFSWHRRQPCARREYCAQYCESDLQLVERLCKEEGMHYYFLHTRTRHIVVFTDELPTDVVVEQPEEDAPLSRLKASIQPLAPRMSMQRACVVGGLFEPAKQDARGRIKVRFEWSNQGDGARFNDCWIPVDPELQEREQAWWGGMEVVVDFRDGDPGMPYISDRLWDPDINPRAQPDPSALSRRIITTRIDKALFLDESQQFSIDDQMIVRMAGHDEMHFRVGTSQVTIDSKSISLSGLRIMLTSIAEAENKSV
ncbi:MULTISPECIES: contractile injection system protein, VgrG/Pvc8 family [unclassified Pseudomonas]|uniref:contractile injection system protein, VgrG/Pvc8 family n=1 Tax=unclassified Pseudomonas TaxID=196821 RepID=UPI0025E5602B|nr:MULTISPECIES: contractile injection system protein, VgrG/Pvc8 family [unclassified Pseudomonas]